MMLVVWLVWSTYMAGCARAYTFNFSCAPDNQTTDASGGGQDEQR
jgi:hypothetical protein